MPQMPELSVIVPVLNERQNVPIMVDRLSAALSGIDWEAVFVDDDSEDGCADVIREIAAGNFRVRLLQRIGRHGLASAAIEGMLSTSSPWLAVMDGDLQHDAELLPQMLETARRGDLDMVVASRHLPGAGMGDFAPERIRLSNAGRFLSGLVLKCRLSDPMSGYFLLSREYFLTVVHDLSQMGFKILLDLVVSAPRPVRLAEVPYVFGTRVYGESKLDLNPGVEFLLLIADKLVGRIVPVRYVLYSLVGLFGVLVHVSLLWVLHARFAVPVLAAQSMATVAAMTSNFLLNNLTTYRDARLTGWRRILAGYIVFAAACGVGLVANLGVVKLLLSHDVFWLFAALGGMIVGSVWNYAVAGVFTWKLVQVRRGRVRRTVLSERQPAAVCWPTDS
jgi:dolichol-phosphate mannosyltransferase